MQKSMFCLKEGLINHTMDYLRKKEDLENKEKAEELEDYTIKDVWNQGRDNIAAINDIEKILQQIVNIASYLC